jgi:hypothetical protein
MAKIFKAQWKIVLMALLLAAAVVSGDLSAWRFRSIVIITPSGHRINSLFVNLGPSLVRARGSHATTRYGVARCLVRSATLIKPAALRANHMEFPKAAPLEFPDCLGEYMVQDWYGCEDGGCQEAYTYADGANGSAGQGFYHDGSMCCGYTDEFTCPN